jgi:hypothetical protein
MGQDFIILPRGIHVWGPEDNELGAIPDDVVERRSKGYVLHRLGPGPGQGWRHVDADKVAIIGDLPDDAMALVASTGDEILDMLSREFGAQKQPGRYAVRIFDKREDFCSYAWQCEDRSLALSMYNPRKGEVALHFGDHADVEDFERTYAHELTHAFMDRTYGVTEPLWFDEGMAQYFSNLQWTKQGFRPTGRNIDAMMHLGEEELMPLRDVLSVTQDDRFVNPPLYYAQAWVLVKFLMKHHPELIKVLLNRKGKLNLEYLSNDYMAYLKRLRRG